MRKKDKGITLITLVVTIIIILILAGVTMASLTKKKGLISEANRAKYETMQKQALELVQEETLRSFDNHGNYSSSSAKLKLETNLKAKVKEKEDKTLIVEYEGFKFSVDKDGEVSILNK